MRKTAINGHSALKFFSENSKVQEQFAEHCFLKDLLFEAATRNKEIAILTSHYDSFGYDLLLEYSKYRRKIQLKSTTNTKYWNVHKSLLEDKAGRVVLIILSEDINKIVQHYKIFNRNKTKAALSRPPKKSKDNKCKLIKSDFEDMGESIFKKIFT